MASGGKGKPVKAKILLARMHDDMRSLNSSVLIITQKIKYLVRNEKILGRNLIVLHKKLKALEEKLAAGQFGSVTGSGIGKEQLQLLQERVEESSRQISALRAELQSLKERAASKEELQEMHYVVDSINPLQFVTIDQAREMLGEKGVKRKKKRKKKK